MKERVAAADGYGKGKRDAAGGGKGKGRKVRTQAGADRYGVPIGEYYTQERGGGEPVARGQKGERTRSAQDALVRLGLLDESSGSGKGRDGLFGPKTEKALREFQKQQGMEVTGKLDADTERALADTAPGGDPDGGKVPPAVAKRLQELDPKQRDEVIRRARKLAEVLRGAKARPGAPRLEEDRAPATAKGGAKLVEFIGGPNSMGVAVYADGSIFDGDGWQDGGGKPRHTEPDKKGRKPGDPDYGAD